MLLALFRKAYRDVTKRRTRSILTILGILIGVGGVVGIVSTGQSLARAQAVAYAQASQADISLWVWNAPASLPRALQEVGNIAAAEVRVDLATRCRWSQDGHEDARDVSLHGVADFENMQVDQVFLRAGRFPRQGELVAEQSVLDATPLRLGDTVTCRGSGGEPDRTFTLVGTVQKPNYPSASLLDFETFYAPSSDVIRLLGATGSNGLLVKVSDLTRAQETAHAITLLLDRRGIQHETPVLRDPDNYVGKRELDALLALLAIFAVVGLVTSGFLVANTLAAIVSEQVSEIGTLKALGGTRAQVMLVYLLSALVYGSIGTVLGLAAGAVGSWQLMLYIGRLLNLTASL